MNNNSPQRFRVWNIINPPNHPKFSHEFNDIDEAVKHMDSWAQDQLTVNWIHSNAFGIEILVDGEWEEVDESEYGYNYHWEKIDEGS